MPRRHRVGVALDAESPVGENASVMAGDVVGEAKFTVLFRTGTARVFRWPGRRKPCTPPRPLQAAATRDEVYPHHSWMVES